MRLSPHLVALWGALVFLAVVVAPATAVGGYGTLKTIGTGTDTVTVLHVGGTPYEIGWWQGTLLGPQVAYNAAAALAVARAEVGQQALLDCWATMAPYIPARFHEELQGLADGSGVPLSDLHEMHAIPELSEYHCSFFNAHGAATADGHMIQIRNLDWSMDLGMQDNPVVVVAQPAGGHKYANITFAGMIGCPAGINEHGIGVSEKGDSFDYANETLAGIPMVFLLRDVLSQTGTLAEANTMLQTANRTSSYWYLVGDADTPDARMYRCSPTIFDTWTWGQDPSGPSWALPDIVYHGMYEDRFFADLSANWGSITPAVAQWICRDIAMTSSLIEAVYDLNTRDIWMAYAEGMQSAALSQFSHLNILEPADRVDDDFESPTGSEASWLVLGPKATFAGGVLELEGANDPSNTISEAMALAANGKTGFVDGLTMAVDMKVVSGAGGLAWGAEGLVQRSSLGYLTHALQVNPASDQVILATEGEGALAVAGVPLEYGAWYRVQVVSTLTNFEVWLAPRGEALVKIIDVAQDALHPGTDSHLLGGLGLYAENAPASTVQFDNYTAYGAGAGARCFVCPNVRAVREQAAVVPVYVNEAGGAARLDFDLCYDTTLLTGLTGPQVEKGSLVAGAEWTLNWQLVAPGQVRVSVTSGTALAAGAAGEVARLTFAVNPAAAPRSAALLDLAAVAQYDALGGSLPAAAWDGGVRIARMAETLEIDAISSPQCANTAFAVSMRARDEYGDVPAGYAAAVNVTDLTGTVVPGSVNFAGGSYSGSFTVAAGHAADTITVTEAGDPAVTATSGAFQVLAKGDVNGDGGITALDVTEAANIAVGLSTPAPPVVAAADYNSDSSVNCLDAICIQNVTLGKALAKAAALDQLLRAAKPSGGVVVTGVGDTIAVPIVVNKGLGVTAFNCDLGYNPSLVTPTGVRVAGLLAGKADWVVVSNPAGSPVRVLSYSNTSTALTSTKKGTLVEVLFTQIGATYGTFSLSNKLVSDQYGAVLGRSLTLGSPYVVR